jgi:hypothetical protein
MRFLRGGDDMDDMPDRGARGVLDLCDPGSDKEKAAEIIWLASVCGTLALAVGRMICSKKRRAKFKTVLKRPTSVRKMTKSTSAKLEALRHMVDSIHVGTKRSKTPGFSDWAEPGTTPVLKNKRTHESFCQDNNAFIRHNVRDAAATYRSLKKDMTLHKSIMNSVVGSKRVYLRALVWACISTLVSGFAQFSVLEYGDASTTQALDCTYTIATDIVFLTMLVADYVSAETARWHSIQHAAWNVQGVPLTSFSPLPLLTHSPLSPRLSLPPPSHHLTQLSPQVGSLTWRG